jgi:hypothetical protein
MIKAAANFSLFTFPFVVQEFGSSGVQTILMAAANFSLFTLHSSLKKALHF